MNELENNFRTQRIGDLTFKSSHKIYVSDRMHGYGSICKTYKTLKPKKSMCKCCRNNFYNHGSNSVSGECWEFKGAEVVDKIGHSSIYVSYGPNVKMVKTLSCWHSIQK